MNFMEEFEAVGAVIKDDHFVYTSGLHGNAYVNKDAIYPHTELTSEACRAIAGAFRTLKYDVVAGPAMGGIILSQWVSYHANWLRCLGREKEQMKDQLTVAVYGEKIENIDLLDGKKVTEGFGFHRGYRELVKGKRVLIVEDVLNTGGSVKMMVDAVQMAGGIVIGVGCLCNRGKVTDEDLGVPLLYNLTTVDFRSWPEEDCSLCRRGRPINMEIGKGKDFVARKGDVNEENESESRAER